MSYSENFPSIRPSFQFSADAGRLDPRITFSRSDTPPTYAAPSAVHYWSNEKHLSSDNLLLQSSDFDTTWANSRLASPTANQTDPAGGTDGYTLTEDSSSGAHRLTQSVTATGDLAFTVFAKQNSGTRYLTLGLFNGNNDTVLAVYDLAGGSPVTATGSSSTYSSVSTSQTASGNGYYKCVLKATGTVTLAGVNLNDASTTSGLDTTLARKVYTGDGTSSIDVAFASLSTTGATDYNATTTQIHREYAPTLKSVSYAGQPRFEYSPTDSASEAIGSSRGLLIEGQSTNLLTNSIDNNVLGGLNNVVEGSQAIAPDGTLTAQKIRVDEDATPAGSFRYSTWSVTSGQKYTISYYVKAAGVSHVAINFRPDNSAFGNDIAYFNLSTGAVDYSSGLDSYGMESCGNGWYRCWASDTATATATATYAVFLSDGPNDTTVVRNGYNGVLLWGGQVENQSFPSSYIATSGSTVTRAADSLSMTDSSLFDNGSGALAAEYDMFAANETSYVLQTARSSGATNNDGVTVYNEGLFVNGAGSNTVVGNTTSNVFHKVAASWEAGSQKISRDGGAVAEDTTTVVPQSGTDKLFIGVRQDGGEPLNGHIKRLALYGEALSDTNLQALTS